MNKVNSIIIACLIFSGLISITNLSAKNIKFSNRDKMIVPGLILVKFDQQPGNLESSTIFNRVIQQYKVEQAEMLFPYQKYKSSPKRKIHDLSYIYRLYVSESTDIEKVCAELNNRQGIVYAEPVYICRAEEVPNDQYYQYQQHLPQIKAPQAWDIVKGDSTVIIAIIDTGVDWDHPDLAARIWNNTDEVIDGTDTDGNGYVDDIRGWDWVTGISDVAPGEDGQYPDNNPMDFDGHGTHCSGDAAAITNNGIGVASVSWNCTIMPLRIGWHGSDGNGWGRSDWMAQAFRYAADNGAHVANLSFGNQKTVAEAARYAFDTGVVIATSAGNNNDEIGDPLSVEPFSLAVAAVDDRDYKTSYSTFGNWVKVSAPGGDFGRPGILSTNFDNSYVSWNGTSFSSPITAGLAGLIKSRHPGWSNIDITFQIINTADNIDHLNPQYAGKLGSGRINAYRAVTEPFTEASPKITLISSSIDDAIGGNGNGVAEAGEQLSVIVEFVNSMGTAYNATAYLNINDWAIEVINNTSYWEEIPGLRNLENNRVDNSTNPFIFKIDSLALPHRIRGFIELVGDNNYSQSFDFVFSISPSILLVDDEELDGENYYYSALDSLNISYEYWDHNVNATPTNLSSYSTVIWACEWTFPSLDATDRTVIANYLNNGGNLFLSGQDIGWDLCDPAPGFDNEFNLSNGVSKTFYESYLHARYLFDDSEFSRLTGVVGDPIGDGLSFNVFQPGREPENQYPSEVTPINNGISIFNYPNENSGAVRYAGAFRTVYFAFGGYEAIVEPEVRFTVMGRVLDWLNGLSVSHTPLNDTEDSEHDYTVQVKATAQAQPIGKVELFWDTDGTLPFINKISMTDMGNDLYEASIPAQPAGTDVQYTIFVQTVSGYYSPIIIRSFHIGPDTKPPTFETVDQIPHTFNKNGPYYLSALISDNLELDSNSVYLHYKTAEATEDSLKMQLEFGSPFYKASFSGNYSYGDTIDYYITAKDKASIPNKAVSDTYQFIIGMDDFENGLDQWEVSLQGWGLETDNPHSGKYYASDSPNQNYIPGTNTSLQLNTALDLSKADSAVLYFWTRYKLQPTKAFGYVELSTDSGTNWIQLENPITGIRPSWIEQEMSLKDYAGMDNILLRFQIQVDESAGANYDGWFIDDVRVLEHLKTGVKANERANFIPSKFFLAQNQPNPFNPETRIAFQLASGGEVAITIYNALGQRVKSLVHENKPAGYYSVIWNGKDDGGAVVASGIYLYRMRLKNFVQTRKMLLLR